MDVEQVVTPGLGDNTYLLVSEGEAAVVDPQRDVGRFVRAAEDRGARIVAVLETHVHNDYVSGAPDLAERSGATLVLPAEGGYRLDGRVVAEGDEVHVGSVRLVALHTPGHTPEHLAYAAFEGGGEWPGALFTGGSLMIGGAGRTDLLGPSRADELTRAQYRSLRRLAAFDDGVLVLPTHGAGSFCGAAEAPLGRMATLGVERGRNRALQAPDEASFVRTQLDGLLAYPSYYARMAPINRAPRAPYDRLPEPGPMGPEDVRRLVERGGWILDGRDRRAFAAAHVPGSVNVELDDSFGIYGAWIVPFDAEVALVVPEPEREAVREAVRQLVRIGFEGARGWLEGGVDAWRAAGLAAGSYATATVEDLCRATTAGARPQVLDVRQRVEWDRGHIPGSRHVFVGDLPARLPSMPRDGEVWTVCASGSRSSMAASLLDREGIPVRLVARGGVEDWLRTCPDGTATVA